MRDDAEVEAVLDQIYTDTVVKILADKDARRIEVVLKAVCKRYGVTVCTHEQEQQQVGNAQNKKSDKKSHKGGTHGEKNLP